MDPLALQKRINELESDPKSYIETYHFLMDKPFETFDMLEAQSLMLLGRAYLITGHQDTAMVPLNRARDLLEKQNALYSLFHCYTYLGVAYREALEYPLALEAFGKAHHLCYELDDFTYVIMALMNLGSVYGEFEDRSQAIEYFEKAMQFKHQVKHSKIFGDLCNNYAHVLMKERQFTRAHELLNTALAIYQAIYKDVPHINTMIALVNIAECYYLMQAYSDAEDWYLEALQLVQLGEINFLKCEIHEKLASLYELKKDFENAYYHYKAYTTYRIIVDAEKNNEAIEQMKAKYLIATEKSESEIHRLRHVTLHDKTVELEKMLKNVSLISDIGPHVISCSSMGDIYETLKASIQRFMTADVFGLALYDSESHAIIYQYFEEKGQTLPSKTVQVAPKKGLASYAIEHQVDVFVPDIDVSYGDYFENEAKVDSNERSRCIFYCRLLIDEKCIGLITLQSYQAFAYTESDFELVKALASYIAIAISNVQKRQLIEEKAAQLEYLSYHDALTGLYNRRLFHMSLDRLRAQGNIPIGLIVGDMNFLKVVNDTYGHMAGDDYLVQIASILKTCAGDHLTFRLSGDEFAILVKHATTQLLNDMMQCIRKACEAYPLHLPVPLSIALGAHCVNASDIEDSDIFSIAEENMYADKKRPIMK